jgi:two-component system sensor histidine kinase KdpD
MPVAPAVSSGLNRSVFAGLPGHLMRATKGRIRRNLRRVNPYAASCTILTAALGFALALPQSTAMSTVNNFLLISILLSALAFGFGPALVMAILSGLAYDFFFLPPRYSLTIDGWEDILAFIIFLLVALATIALAMGVRIRAGSVRRRELFTSRLYRFIRKLAMARDARAIAGVAASHLGGTLGMKAAILVPSGDTLTVAATHPAHHVMDADDLPATIAQWQSNECSTMELSSPGVPHCIRIDSAGKLAGVLWLSGETRRRQVWPLSDQRRFIHLVLGQTAAALERDALARELETARLAAETERLRSALLTSISHDLKTPLAAILASASGLVTLEERLDQAAARELLTVICEESEQLNQFIANLLDMARVEAAAIGLRRESTDIADVVASVLRRAEKQLAKHRVAVDVPSNIPLVELDPILLGQVLFNLLDNAAKHTPPGTEICLSAAVDHDKLELRVADEGAGIPASGFDRLFQKFSRLEAEGPKPAGTGLGLAISRGFVEAMDGSIAATNRTGRPGAIFTIALPLGSQIAQTDAGSKHTLEAVASTPSDQNAPH